MKPPGAVAIVVALVVVACSGPSKVVLGYGEPSQSAQAGQGGESNGGGAGESGGVPPASGGLPPGAGATGGTMVFPPGTLSAGGAESCRRVVAKAELMPRDVYLMVDRSERTNTPLPGSPGGTYWGEIARGLALFSNEAALGITGIGLQFFPLGGAAQASCSADYGAPGVEIDDPLENRVALGAALAAQVPRGPRPTGPALAGAIAHAKAWASAHVPTGVTVVLVTSGVPDACSPADVQGIADIARAGHESTPSVETHVVALGPEASTAGWDAVSLAGGTMASSTVDGGHPGATLHGALRRLLGTRIECGYDLKTLASGGDEWSDASRITVKYTSAGNTFRLFLVSSVADCALSGGGFYFVPGYPAESRPSRIELCPSTCDAVQGGEVEFGYGCPRGPIPAE